MGTDKDKNRRMDYCMGSVLPGVTLRLIYTCIRMRESVKIEWSALHQIVSREICFGMLPCVNKLPVIRKVENQTKNGVDTFPWLFWFSICQS